MIFLVIRDRFEETTIYSYEDLSAADTALEIFKRDLLVTGYAMYSGVPLADGGDLDASGDQD